MARWQCVAAATLLTLALPPGLLPAGAPCPAETEALLTLRAALSPAEGGVLGDWTGDVCGSSGTAWSGVVADNGRVLAINLSNLGLSGMIPGSLFTAITSLTVRIKFVFTMQAGCVRDDAVQPCRPFHIDHASMQNDFFVSYLHMMQAGTFGDRPHPRRSSKCRATASRGRCRRSSEPSPSCSAWT